MVVLTAKKPTVCMLPPGVLLFRTTQQLDHDHRSPRLALKPHLLRLVFDMLNPNRSPTDLKSLGFVLGTPI